MRVKRRKRPAKGVGGARLAGRVDIKGEDEGYQSPWKTRTSLSLSLFLSSAKLYFLPPSHRRSSVDVLAASLSRWKSSARIYRRRNQTPCAFVASSRRIFSRFLKTARSPRPSEKPSDQPSTRARLSLRVLLLRALVLSRRTFDMEEGREG